MIEAKVVKLGQNQNIKIQTRTGCGGNRGGTTYQLKIKSEKLK